MRRRRRGGGGGALTTPQGRRTDCSKGYSVSAGRERCTIEAQLIYECTLSECRRSSDHVVTYQSD